MIATATRAVRLYWTDTEDYGKFALHSRRLSATGTSMASNDLEERFKGIGLADSTAKWVAAQLTFDSIANSFSILFVSVEVARPPIYISFCLTDVLHWQDCCQEQETDS